MIHRMLPVGNGGDDSDISFDYAETSTTSKVAVEFYKSKQNDTIYAKLKVLASISNGETISNVIPTKYRPTQETSCICWDGTQQYKYQFNVNGSIYFNAISYNRSPAIGATAILVYS